MNINNFSCRMCLVQCSDTDSPFWHYEHLFESYCDFSHFSDNPVPSKICSDCLGKLARLVAFRNRMRSIEQKITEDGDPEYLYCRCCLRMCDEKERDLLPKASSIDATLLLCSVSPPCFDDNNFCGLVCLECVRDLNELGFYLRKCVEVNQLFNMEEFDKSFDHSKIDSYELLIKCQKHLEDFRETTGDDQLLQELAYLSHFSGRSHTRHTTEKSLKNVIPIAPNSIFELLLNDTERKMKNKSETIQNEEFLEETPKEESINLTFSCENDKDINENESKIDENDTEIHKNKQKIDENDPEIDESESETNEKAPQKSSKTPESVQFTCQNCSYTTNNKYKLKEHTKKHNSALWLSCDMCPGRKFINKAYLVNHMKRFHLPRKTISCAECGQEFKDHASKYYHRLARHVDSSQWKYTCVICGKKCYSKFHLNEHENTHTDIRSFFCSICDFSFKKSSNLKRHLKTQHGKEME